MQTTDESVQALATFINANSNLLIITGAGCSAPSGIPTYRDKRGIWQHTAPIQHQDFMSSERARMRYWARSFAGWPAVRDASPNVAHQALAAVETLGHTSLLVTQNVDGLHQKAGNRSVIDLHGRLDRVECLTCRAVSYPRQPLA